MDLDASTKKIMVLMTAAATFAAGVTKLADITLFKLHTPKDYQGELESRLAKADSNFISHLDHETQRWSIAEQKSELFRDSVRVSMHVVEIGLLLDCISATPKQRNQFAVARINCETVASKYGVRLP